MFFLISLNPYCPAAAVICITGEADRDKCFYPWVWGIRNLVLAVNEILDIDSIVNIEKSEFSFVFRMYCPDSCQDEVAKTCELEQ